MPMLKPPSMDPRWADVAQTHPDARALVSRNEKKHKLLGWFEECFCVNCGKPQGMITKDWAPHVFVLCDDCVATHGALPLPTVPESVVKGYRS